MSILRKIFDGNKREVKSLSKQADQVLELESTMSALSDEQLLEKTQEFQARLKDHKDDIKQQNKRKYKFFISHCI